MKNAKILCMFLIILILTAACSPGATPGTPGQPTNPEQTENKTPNPPEQQTPVAENLLLDENASANQDILPRGFEKDSLWLAAAKGATLTMYYANENISFSYTDSDKNTVTDSAWLRKLKSEYDITLHMVRKNKATSLAAQSIALLSDAELDILSFAPDQLLYAKAMTADLSLLLDENALKDMDYLNPSVLRFGGSGVRYLMPAGVSRALWYAETDTKSDSFALSQKKAWDFSAFTKFVSDGVKVENEKVTKTGIEIGEVSDLLAALGSPLISEKDGVLQENDALSTLTALQKLFSANGVYSSNVSGESAPSLLNGDLCMRYGSTPFVRTADKYPTVSWAPLPVKDGADSVGTVSACAPILALPKGSSHANAALGTALLFTARMSDANHDRLRFTYGLSFEKWSAYYNFTNEHLQIVWLPEEETKKTLGALLTDASKKLDEEYPALRKEIVRYVGTQNYKLSHE